MNAILFTAALALGQTSPTPVAPTSTALDGVWTVVAAEVNGRPEIVSDGNRSLAIKNNTLTLPGVAALHGTVQLELGRNGTLRAIPAAIGHGCGRHAASGRPDDLDRPAPSFTSAAASYRDRRRPCDRRAYAAGTGSSNAAGVVVNGFERDPQRRLDRRPH
jgi:hypothetical protein